MRQLAKKQYEFARNIIYILIAAILISPINMLFSNESDIRINNDSLAVGNLNRAGSDVIPDEAIIKFKPGILEKEPKLDKDRVSTAVASIDIIFDQFKVSDIKKLYPKPISQLNDIYHIKFPPLFQLADVLTQLKNDPNVEWAEPNYLLTTCDTPDDYNSVTQWGLAKIKAPQAWDYTHGSTDVTIAIVDTGVDHNHPDLADNIWVNVDEIPDNGIDDDGNGFIDDNIGWDFVSATSGGAVGEDMGPRDNNPMDFDGHGTHCSGIASAVTNNGIGIAGTGWNCKIMAVRSGYKGTDGYGHLTSADAAAAITYAADNGANIISMSWGGTGTLSTVLVAINHARTKGCVLVAAAGNGGSIGAFYPAYYDGVIAVAASTQTDARAYFSNYGSWIEVAAPGVNIYSTYFNDTYEWLDGTSMAAPCVAGLAGLILSINPLLNANDVATKIISNADTTSWIKRVNAYRAVINSIPITVFTSENIQVGQDVVVTANVGISSNAADLTLYYKQGGKTDYQELPFTLVSGTLKAGVWNTTIPANQINTRGIVYYVSLTDVNGKSCSYGDISNPHFIEVHGNISIEFTVTQPNSANAWNFIAPSVITDDKTVGGNFPLFGTFGVNWIAWRWNATDEQWEVSQTLASYPVSSDPFDVTSSWWVALDDGDNLTVDIDVAGTSVDSSKPYAITLKTGWNSIANPFDYPVAWSDANITVEYSGDTVTLTQAESNGWVDNRAIWYNNEDRQNVIRYSYEDPPYVMPPKCGQWLYSLVDGAKLIIPPIEYISSPAPSVAHQGNENSWRIALSLKTEIGVDNVEAIVSEDKSNKHDLNYIKPPLSPSSRVRIDLARPEYEPNQIIWELVVRTPVDGHLQWGFINVPDDYSLAIKEDGTGKTVDLRRKADFLIAGNEFSQRFTLKAIKQRIPIETQVFANYPNPFNPETWIPYELSSESDVVVKIYTSFGQLVRILDLGRKPAGVYTSSDKAIYWDGKNEYGEKVSSGIYFYSIKAGDKIFNHKMVILR